MKSTPIWGDGVTFQPYDPGPKLLHYSGPVVTTTHMPPGRRPLGDRISSYGVPPQFRPHRLGHQRGQFKLRK